MNLPKSASVFVRAIRTEWKFEWLGFDDDDGFSEFNIIILNVPNECQFRMGPAVLRSLRNLTRFFEDDGQKAVRGGFRCPDIRTFDLEREGKDFLLVVSTEDGKNRYDFRISNPDIRCDAEILNDYDSGED